MKLVAFDLDMTLLDHATYAIPDSALRAIKELKAVGHKVVIASGRDMHNKYGMPFLELVQPDAVVELNGARVVAGEQVLFMHLFDHELLNKVISFAEQKGYAVGTSREDDNYYTHPEVIVKEEIRRWGESGRKFKDIERLQEIDVHSLCYVGAKEGVFELRNEFPTLKIPFFPGEWGADIMEKIVSKANGLKVLCEHYGISMQDVIAFGDEMNDIEMIQEAGLGIAMGNANEELKAAADYVTDPIDQDGVWNACRNVGLLN